MVTQTETPNRARAGKRRHAIVERAVATIAQPRSTRSPSRRELAMAFVGIGVLALAVYVPHVISGGWYLDDWIMVDQLAAANGPLEVLRVSNDMTYRPGHALLVSLLFAIGGEGQSPYLAVGLMLAAVESWMFYLVLRRLRVNQPVSGVLAALFLVLPCIDASRLWIAAFPIQVAGILYLLGLLAALRGLRPSDRARPILWHGLAFVLYLAALLTYELVVGLILLAPVLYGVGFGWRRAVRRGLSDYVAVAVGLAIIAPRASADRGATTTFSYLWDRAVQTWTPAQTVFRSLVPWSDLLAGPVGLGLLVVGLVGAGVAIGERSEVGRGLAAWAAMAAIGLFFALAGLVMLLPADPYFVPRATGLGDRTGAFAAFGGVVVLVALIVLSAGGLGVLSRRPWWGFLAAGVLVLVTLGTLTIRERNQQSPWARAWSDQQQIVASIRAAVGPTFPVNGAIVTFRHPLFLEDDVSVFAYSWDLRGAMWHAYDDPTALAHPWTDGSSCQPTGIGFADGSGVPSNNQGTRPVAPYAYRNLFFVDVASRTATRIRDQSACQRAVAALDG